MRREAHQIQAKQKRPALDLLQRRGRFILHLHVQEFDAVESHVRRVIDALLDRAQLRIFELPERVRRNADAIGPPRRSGGWPNAGDATLAASDPAKKFRRVGDIIWSRYFDGTEILNKYGESTDPMARVLSPVLSSAIRLFDLPPI